MTSPAEPTAEPTGLIGIAKEVFKRFGRHNVMVIAAGIAFYAVLAIVPTIIAGLLTFALIIDPSELETELISQTDSLDDTTRTFVQGELLPDVIDQVKEARKSGTGGVAAALVLALWSASGAVQKLMKVTATAYEAEETRSGWKMRLLAYGATAAAIVVIGVLIAVLGVLPLLGDELGLGESAQAATALITFPVVAVMVMLAFTLLYRYSPDRSPRTPWINPGAIIATLGFLIIAFAFTTFSAQVATLGAAGIIGSVAVLLLFFQLSTAAVIVGAEVNAVVEHVGAAATASDPTQVLADGTEVIVERVPTRPVKFWQALAGVVAIFALGRNQS